MDGRSHMTGIDRRFPRRVAAVVLVAAAVLSYPLARFAPPAVTVAVVAGAVISTVNALTGFLMIEYAFARSYSMFLKVVIGGMGLRMLFMLGILLVLILGARVHAVGLTVSTLAFYLVYLVLEILFIQTKVVVKGQE